MSKLLTAVATIAAILPQVMLDADPQVGVNEDEIKRRCAPHPYIGELDRYVDAGWVESATNARGNIIARTWKLTEFGPAAMRSELAKASRAVKRQQRTGLPAEDDGYVTPKSAELVGRRASEDQEEDAPTPAKAGAGRRTREGKGRGRRTAAGQAPKSPAARPRTSVPSKSASASTPTPAARPRR